MDKYEYSLKLEEINKLVEQEAYEDAAVIVDTIEWKRVRNTRTLCMVSEIYEANGRLEESKEILLRAYQRSKLGRTVLYRLTEVAVKMGEFDEAVEYYSEFVNSAPNDHSRYILKYKIYKGRGSSLEDQISILEEYKEIEYTEKWSYELAKLYYKADEKQKCIQECDDLVLWFRQGPYVVKSLEMKKKLTALTPIQQAIYDNKEQTIMEKHEQVEAILPTMEKVILDNMPSSEEEALTENIISETEKEIAQAVTQHAEEKEETEEDWGFTANAFTSDTQVIRDVKEETEPEEVKEEIGTEEAEETVNQIQQPISGEELQQSLAASMHQIVSGMTRGEQDADIMAPMNDYSFLDDGEDEADAKEQDGEENQSIDDILTSMAGVSEETAVAKDQIQEEERSHEEAPASIKDAEEVSEMKEATEPEKFPAIDLSEALEMAAGITDLKPEIRKEEKVEKVELKQEKVELKQEVKKQESFKLTEEQKYIFSYFSRIQGLHEQVAQTLDGALQKIKKDKTSKSGNIVITGLQGSGRTTLGIRFAKAISLEKGEKSARIAKIYAEDFNEKDIAATVAKIAGGTLIIEEAGDLEDEVIRQLSKAMEFRTDGLLVILEDENHLLKPVFEKHPVFAEKFTSEINVPIFTNDELVYFGKTYANDEDYKIDEMATLALYNHIGELQSPDRPVTIRDVKDILDKAIRRSERFSLRKLGKLISHKRYDEDDRIILYEKDFR